MQNKDRALDAACCWPTCTSLLDSSVEVQLRSCVAGDRVKQLVLDLLEEQHRFLFPDLVVRTQGEDVPDFLVHSRVRRPDFAGAGQQLIKVIPAAGIPEAFIVHDEPLDDELVQMGVRSLAKLRSASGPHPKTNRQNEFEIVELSPVLPAVSGSCQGFLDN